VTTSIDDDIFVILSPPHPQTKKTYKQKNKEACLQLLEETHKQTKQARKRREEVGLKRRGAWFFLCFGVVFVF
jgi:hypothetical protein